VATAPKALKNAIIAVKPIFLRFIRVEFYFCNER
jgi:hypothetical protein